MITVDDGGCEVRVDEVGEVTTSLGEVITVAVEDDTTPDPAVVDDWSID